MIELPTVELPISLYKRAIEDGNSLHDDIIGEIQRKSIHFYSWLIEQQCNEEFFMWLGYNDVRLIRYISCGKYTQAYRINDTRTGLMRVLKLSTLEDLIIKRKYRVVNSPISTYNNGTLSAAIAPFVFCQDYDHRTGVWASDEADWTFPVKPWKISQLFTFIRKYITEHYKDMRLEDCHIGNMGFIPTSEVDLNKQTFEARPVILDYGCVQNY